MNKKSIFTIIISIGYLGLNAQTKKPVTKAPVKTIVKAPVKLSQQDSASYGFGLKIAEGLKNDGVKSLNYSLISKAMQSVFSGSATMLTSAESEQAIARFLAEVRKQKFASAIADGDKFLAENKVKPNIITLPSGLQYQVIKAATGQKPKATDEVTVHYTGTLTNGKKFDSSYDRNEPVTFPLNKVIPGWTEGVQQMPVGSKYRLFIPAKLGYGENGAGEDIPPYSVLIFDIELIKIGATTPVEAIKPATETTPAP